MLLQTEFAMGLLAKTPGFVLEELLLCHSSECWGRERLCLGGHLQLLPCIQGGNAWRDGAEAGSEAGPEGKRNCEGATDPKFTAIVAVDHHGQRQYPAFLPKTHIFCLLGCSAMMQM